MLRPTLLLLLLLLSLGFTAPTPAQADTILYVKPTEGTKCPGEPCHTLDEYVNETNHREYFPYNNTIMIFLPGTHNLSEVFQFHGATNLTMEATYPTMAETLISCNDDPQYLNFIFGSQITIKGLSIVNCSTLQFHKSAYVQISSLRVTLFNLHNGGSGISAHFVDSINVSWVSIHLPEHGNRKLLVGIGLFDVFGNCVFEQVDVIGHNDQAMFMQMGKKFPIQYLIRNCSFELTIAILYYGVYSDSHINIIFENIFIGNVSNVRNDQTAFFIVLQPETKGSKVYTAVSVTLRNVTFANNTYIGRNVAGVRASNMYIQNIHNVTLIDCEFYNNFGTPISAIGSTLHLSGDIVFRNNTGYDGGAMRLTGGSYIYISNDTYVMFENNAAENAGGAVFVDQNTVYCFFRESYRDSCNCERLNFNLSFINNTAQKGGDAIYGAGFIDCWYCYHHCTIDPYNPLPGLHFEPSFDSDRSLISSDPTRVCLCKNGTVDCSITSLNETHYPGEEFTISAVDVGDVSGIVEGPVYAQFLPQYSEAVLGELQHYQQVNHKCTELRYSVSSEPGQVVMALTVNNDRIVRYHSLRAVYIYITLPTCPLGFILSEYPHQCIRDIQLEGNHTPI